MWGKHPRRSVGITQKRINAANVYFKMANMMPIPMSGSFFGGVCVVGLQTGLGGGDGSCRQTGGDGGAGGRKSATFTKLSQYSHLTVLLVEAHRLMGAPQLGQ